MGLMTERPVLYLIDGSAYLYRAFFALPDLSTTTGVPTNAVYGFTTMLQKIIRERRPQYLAVAFDEKGPTLRHVEFKEYKAHRPPMPDALSRQIPYIHRVVEAFAIPVVKLAGYEADDLIGTLAAQASSQGLEVVIVTGDKDMFQLLSPAVRIYDPVKDKFLTEEDCLDRFGVEPARVVEVMGLMGDATDNIPGVKGIGEKTAKKLIAEFGTIENLLTRLSEVKGDKLRALLEAHADEARRRRARRRGLRRPGPGFVFSGGGRPRGPSPGAGRSGRACLRPRRQGCLAGAAARRHPIDPALRHAGGRLSTEPQPPDSRPGDA